MLTLDSTEDWFDDARRVRSPNFDARPPGCAVDLIVVHGISLPPGEYGRPCIEQLFCNELDPHVHPSFRAIASMTVSAHLLIPRDGSLVQFVALSNRAWHGGGVPIRGPNAVQRFLDRHRAGRHGHRTLRECPVRASGRGVPRAHRALARDHGGPDRGSLRHRAAAQDRPRPGIRLEAVARWVAGADSRSSSGGGRRGGAMMRGLAVLVVLGAVCLPRYAASVQCPTLSDARLRTAFVEAERSPPNGRGGWERLHGRIGDYALYPYVELAGLKRKSPQAPTPEVEAFLARYDAQPVSLRIRTRWLRQLASRREWRKFIEWYPADAPIDLQCQYARALLATGDESGAFTEAQRLWDVRRVPSRGMRAGVRAVAEVGSVLALSGMGTHGSRDGPRGHATGSLSRTVSRPARSQAVDRVAEDSREPATGGHGQAGWRSGADRRSARAWARATRAR